MSAPQPMAYDFFFKTALEYYVNGRAACLSGCVFTTGNLLHHAVEMMLKGELSRTIPLEDLKEKKNFGHSLPKCWAAFKALFPTEDLTEFDPMIAELDRFEKIRYPDHILAHGAGIGFGFGRWRPGTVSGGAKPVPQYTLAIGDVDAFIARAIRLCHMNPKPYFSFLTPEGRNLLQKYNDERGDWLS
jgi:hypothetical protein